MFPLEETPLSADWPFLQVLLLRYRCAARVSGSNSDSCRKASVKFFSKGSTWHLYKKKMFSVPVYLLREILNLSIVLQWNVVICNWLILWKTRTVPCCELQYGEQRQGQRMNTSAQKQCEQHFRAVWGTNLNHIQKSSAWCYFPQCSCRGCKQSGSVLVRH